MPALHSLLSKLCHAGMYCQCKKQLPVKLYRTAELSIDWGELSVMTSKHADLLAFASYSLLKQNTAWEMSQNKFIKPATLGLSVVFCSFISGKDMCSWHNRCLMDTYYSGHWVTETFKSLRQARCADFRWFCQTRRSKGRIKPSFCLMFSY